MRMSAPDWEMYKDLQRKLSSVENLLSASERFSKKMAAEYSAMEKERDEDRLTLLTIAGVLGYSAPPSHSELCTAVRCVHAAAEALSARNRALEERCAGLEKASRAMFDNAPSMDGRIIDEARAALEAK